MLSCYFLCDLLLFLARAKVYKVLVDEWPGGKMTDKNRRINNEVIFGLTCFLLLSIQK